MGLDERDLAGIGRCRVQKIFIYHNSRQLLKERIFVGQQKSSED
jgi:hypothetical protein